MVGPDGVLPLPWLEEPLRLTLLTRRAHALLVHGPQGVGQFELALTLAQAWLCDAPDEPQAKSKPCGVCASCKLVQSRSHPDLLVVLPEALRDSLGWSNDAQGDDSAAEKNSKTKPSKEIKVEAVRAVVAFAQTTAARGRGKLVVMHPAERMNAISANTLLKTLEEPPGDARFVLSCAIPDSLLPTIRSRCQAAPLAAPRSEQALAWLVGKGVEHAEVLLRATGGQPLEALDWSRHGVDAEHWLRLPALVARGEAAALTGWPLPRLVNALQKLCHDALCVAVGALPRYFPASELGQAAGVIPLTDWARSLTGAAQHAEHPWHAGLMTEALIHQGQRALSKAAAASRAKPGV